ncbi:MAG: hypothetical protein RLZZ397_545 [Pseudomonadota bacterium]|jgi:3-hydroxyisobutyrate dehydrogenase-like beta-hydroxyacid dehydrogenase
MSALFQPKATAPQDAMYQPARVAFVGLGVMGGPMAAHLAHAGHQVTVYNRNAAKAQAWLQEVTNMGLSARVASTPAQAAAEAEVVFVCVGNDDDVRQVVLGPEGLMQSLKAQSVVVDHTTTSAEVARELSAELKRYSVAFVDAPVSGGQVGAQQGMLTVMCGGEEEAFARAKPLIMAFAKACTYMGPSGYGQLTKMVNQICIAGLLQGLSEAVAFGQRAGLDMHRVLDVIGKGAAQSWQMDNRGKTMVEDRFDFGFAVDWMRKDLGLVLTEGKRLGATLPVTELVNQMYAEVQAMGGGRWDTSSLIKRLI